MYLHVCVRMHRSPMTHLLDDGGVLGGIDRDTKGMSVCICVITCT